MTDIRPGSTGSSPEAPSGNETAAAASGAAGAQGAAVQAAVEDFALRAGVPVEDVQVESLEDVVWRDSSLGCPEPGAMYAKSLVPGTRLVLRAGGQTGSYHGERGGDLAYCANPVVPPPAGDR